MASLRRSKALSPDGQTARFLYTILKQLDLKAIDWNLVANGLDITNGHAARMRFSRFKQHMEGKPTQPRNPRPKKDGGKDSKDAKGKRLKRGLDDDVKEEGMKGEDGEADEARIKPRPRSRIKDEPGMMEESGGIEQPPPVRVKRELQADGIVSQPNSRQDYHVLPGQSHKLVPATNLASPPPVEMKTQVRASVISPPPMATVSLADLHLSTSSILSPPHSNGIAPSLVFSPRTPTPPPSGDLACARIKTEPGLIGNPMQAAVGPTLVKREPMDA